MWFNVFTTSPSLTTRGLIHSSTLMMDFSTSFNNHDIDPKVIGYFEHLFPPLLEVEYCRLVFIVPPQSTLTSIQTRDKGLAGLKLFSAVLPSRRSISAVPQGSH